MAAPSARSSYAAPHPLARLGPAALWAVALLALALVCALDARKRRARSQGAPGVRAAAARVVGPELALHSASRWLRHPTRSEPWAASADGPAVLDVDPAGALAPPPADVLRSGLPGVKLRTTRGPRP